MISRTLLHISLGVFLTGCTITNNLNSGYQRPDLESQDRSTRQIQKAPIEAEEEYEEDDIAAIIRKKADVAVVRPKKPQTVPQQPQTRRQSEYCKAYDPLALPALVRVDEEKYLTASKADDEKAIRDLLATNIAAINNQINNYRGNLKRHRDEWLKTCGK